MTESANPTGMLIGVQIGLLEWYELVLYYSV